MSYPAQTSRPRQHGFTLIELVVVMAVVAVLIAIGMPALRDLLVRNEFAAVTNEFTGLVASARSSAIKLNRSVSLCKAASATATACDTGANNAAQSWQHWLIVSSTRNAGGAEVTNVISQGTIPHAENGNVTLTSRNIRFNAAGNLSQDLPTQPTIGTDKQCRTMTIYRSGTLFPKTANNACS